MWEWLCLLFAGVAFYLILSNLGTVLGGAGRLLRILSPFAGGALIAYVLNPMVEGFQYRLLRGEPRWRWAAILLSYLTAILLVALLGWLVVPQLVKSAVTLFTNLPGYVAGMQQTLYYLQENYHLPVQSFVNLLEDSEALMREVYNMASSAVPQIVGALGNAASNFVAVFTAVASSIYMLSGKQKLLRQLRTMAHAFLPPRAARRVLRICHYANENFTAFFIGKIIDSAIIGVLTFTLMSFLRLDFALLVSVFVGVANIIPVFGPFIGAIPSLFILLLVDPLQALVFAVLVVVIQQLDSNLISPKVLGQSVGISPLWVLFAIVVGGGLFGVPGMIVGVPVFATLYGVAQEAVAALLRRRGIDAEGRPAGGTGADAPDPAEEETEEEREPAAVP